MVPTIATVQSIVLAAPEGAILKACNAQGIHREQCTASSGAVCPEGNSSLPSGRRYNTVFPVRVRVTDHDPPRYQPSRAASGVWAAAPEARPAAAAERLRVRSAPRAAFSVTFTRGNSF